MTSFWFEAYQSHRHLLYLFLWAVLISPSFSSNCTSHVFTGRENYPSCVDLLLSSYLHYSYDARNSTLAVVFSGKPVNPAGWIAWGINPRGRGKVGTQTLIAYREPTGVVVAKTYRVDSVELVVQSKLSFDVWNLKTEEFGEGGFRIFAKIKVPENMAATKMVYQVWQTGPGVTNSGELGSHELEADNLSAMSKLDLEAVGTRSSVMGYGETAASGLHRGGQNAAYYAIVPVIGILVALLRLEIERFVG